MSSEAEVQRQVEAPTGRRCMRRAAWLLWDLGWDIQPVLIARQKNAMVDILLPGSCFAG